MTRSSARDLIAEAMTDNGAELVDGTWHFEGQPIRIKLVGRVEDERRDIADLVRAELEAAGFDVAITYDQFGPAVQKVYSTDPAAFEWHIYTEGWGRIAPSAMTSAPSMPSSLRGWARCPAGARRASGSTRTMSSMPWARRCTGASSTASRSATRSTAR